ncbi:MAG: hypothetical protein WA705_01215 [Candidatus Ozemobacteraceae bacterium]
MKTDKNREATQILLVDDDCDLPAIHREWLTKAGFRVGTVSGSSAARLIEEINKVVNNKK